MPNVNAVLNDQIRRLARREIRANTRTIKKATGHYRRDIAALKRHVAQLIRQVAALQKQNPNRAATPPAELIQKSRLRIDGLKTHRAKLGISAADYGQLLGVSGLTVYNWENGKSKPRRSQLPRIVAVRGIGKREALQRLGQGGTALAGGANGSATTPKPRKRGTFRLTAEQLILGLLKGRKSLRTGAINATWKRSGRAGNADNTLSLMVKARKIKRSKAPTGRGSIYSAA